MERKFHSSERKLAGIRTHNKKQSKLDVQPKKQTYKGTKEIKRSSRDRNTRSRSRNKKSRSISRNKSKSKNKPIPRKRYSIKEKMEYVEQYDAIKKIDEKKDLILFLKN